MTSVITKSFEDISRKDASIAGGKGASLGEMTRAGIPVPPGFVILALAFERFLSETDLNVEIDTILHSVDIEKMHTVEHASEMIQKLILEAQMPEDIALEIEEKFDVLGETFVAVRSSATAEDSDSAAWAGQLDSFLNTTEETLLKNVQRCWASLFTPRAIFYRFEKELHKQKISVAVVVQKMVESEFSGIAFSVHPVTEDRNQLIIEAGYGLGEAIVSGQVTPDSYVVEKEPRKIIDINISEQSKALYRKEHGGNEWKDLGEKGKEQVLNTEQILELSELIIRIENHYGFPCDIEWAVGPELVEGQGRKFYITQSRPITTLTGEDVESKSERILGKADPVTIPEDWENSFMLGGQDIDTSFLALEMIWAGMQDKMIKEQIGVSIPDSFEEIIRGTTINTYVLTEPATAFIEKAANALQTKPELLAHLKKNTIETARAIREFADLHIKKIAGYDALNCARILLEIKKLQSACIAYGTVVSWADVSGIISQGMMDIINRRKELKYPRHWYSHVLGSPESPSLTEQAKEEIKNSKRTDELVEKYYWLDQGFIGRGLTFEQLQAIKAQQEEKENEKITATREELQSELNLMEEEERCFEVFKNILFMKSLRVDSRQYLFVVVNRIAEQLGKIWNREPKLVSVMCAEEIAEIVNENKPLPHNLPERFDHSILIPEDNGAYTILVGREREEFLAQTLRQENVSQTDSIKGQIAYQGLVRGRAKLVFGPQHNEKVKDGDILVSVATSPQLLPAMMRATAFVTDIGGITSHAAIVARELRKPCIVGTKFATQVLHDRDLVEVDADNGIVRILEKADNDSISQKYFVSRSRMGAVPFPTNWNGISQTSQHTHLLHGSGVNTVGHYYCRGKLVGFFLLDEWSKVSKEITDRIIEDDQYVIGQYNKQKKISVVVQNFLKGVSKKQLNVLTTEDLFVSYQELEDLWTTYDQENLTPWFFGSAGVLSTVKERLKGIDPESVQLLCTNPVPSFSQCEELEIFEVAYLLQKNDIDLDELSQDIWKRIDSLVARYYWVPFGYNGPNVYSREHYCVLLKEIVGGSTKSKIAEKIKKLKNYETHIRNEQLLIIERFNISEETKNLIEKLHLLEQMTDERKMVTFPIHVIFDQVLDGISQNMNVDKSLLTYLTLDEIKQYLGDKKNIEQLGRDRKENGVLFLWQSGTLSICDSDVSREYMKNVIQSPSLLEENILFGETGSRGVTTVVRGIVRILFTPNDLKRLLPGEILVAPMTTPEYVPAMRRSMAIITDEGGVTCHAAIIARELNIPCIIGTKFATQVLHDGDLIEVDADNGMVRILEKSNSKN